MSGFMAVTIPVPIPTVRASSTRQQRPGRCQAPNTVCNNKVASDCINGEVRQSLYCDWHHCRFVEGGRMCQIAKPPRNGRYCKEHLRCKGMDRGVQCANTVKDGDPYKWSFCAELHLCMAEGCHDERCRTGGNTSRFCRRHGCHYTACCERSCGGLFCVMHTCIHDGCVSQRMEFSSFCGLHEQCQGPCCDQRRGGAGVGGRGAGGGGVRFGPECCAYAGCRRSRGDGLRFCSEHRCGRRGCENERGAGRYCVEHTCLSPRCRAERVGTRFCEYHRCSVTGCEQEAVGETEGVCARHGLCVEPGCRGRRFVQHGTTHDQCERHYRGVCAFSGRGSGACGAPAVGGTRFCLRHLCMRRTCANARMPGYELCRDCKCEVSECRRMRIMDRDEGDGHRGATLCEGHECREPGCRQRRDGDGDGGNCREHARCAFPGCDRPVNAPRRPRRFCYEHVEPRGDRDRGTRGAARDSEETRALREALARQEQLDEETRRDRLLREYERDLARQRARDLLSRNPPPPFPPSPPPRHGSPWQDLFP